MDLPQFICISCLSRVKKSHHLKSEFLKNDEHLKNLLKNPTLKTEPDIFEEVEVKCDPMEHFLEADDFNDTIKVEDNIDSSFQSELVDRLEPTFDDEESEENDWKPSLKPLKTKGSKRSYIKKESIKEYICYICDLKFINNRKKNEHISEVHEKEATHVCSICAYICAGGKLLDTHMQVHKEEASFFCPILSGRVA